MRVDGGACGGERRQAQVLVVSGFAWRQIAEKREWEDVDGEATRRGRRWSVIAVVMLGDGFGGTSGGARLRMEENDGGSYQTKVLPDKEGGDTRWWPDSDTRHYVV
ncbi:hypothetical protein L1987_69089 [Smallanthus sonchifolius]|uniref:Uncharacterized protein n=1 Tax=Smallanthus sonchifolius TaxID=185202 RepID=A0ACB9B5G1_9ASTR|nr:hypothetical protein L1987_69089 [Smallanthus sonchifolius]